MMLKFRQTLCAAFGAAALLSFAAAADAVEYSEADIDEDGYVSMDEFDDVMPDAGEETYAQIDADQDGQITETEWNSAMDIGIIPSNGGMSGTGTTGDDSATAD